MRRREFIAHPYSKLEFAHFWGPPKCVLIRRADRAAEFIEVVVNARSGKRSKNLGSPH